MYDWWMIKTTATRLKANLGKYLRVVRRGQEVLVIARDEPVARLVPVDPAPPARRGLVISPRDPTAPTLGQITAPAIRYRGKSTTELLREDRDRR